MLPQKKSQRDERCEAKFDGLARHQATIEMGSVCHRETRSVAYDNASVAGHNDFGFVATSRPAQGCNATTKNTGAPSDLRHFVTARRGNAQGGLRSRAGASVVQANGFRDVWNGWRTRAANRFAANGLAASRAAVMMTSARRINKHCRS